ncbi:hypothetical protein J6590_019981 [Homalodisca vitripennis]|nr:hypothetical protein J6590_019981 [Homalodisca vitripennis]
MINQHFYCVCEKYHGDSHEQHLDGIDGLRGDRLLQTWRKTPPVASTYCEVLIAGTNELSAEAVAVSGICLDVNEGDSPEDASEHLGHSWRRIFNLCILSRLNCIKPPGVQEYYFLLISQSPGKSWRCAKVELTRMRLEGLVVK